MTRKILFLTNSAIGDAVLTTSALSWLLEEYPKGQFTIVSGALPAPLFAGFPRLEKLIAFRKERYKLHWLKLWWQLVGTHWDVVVDMRQSALAYLLWAKKRLVASHNRGGARHKLEEIKDALGMPRIYPTMLWAREKERAVAERLLPDGAFYIALAPFTNWVGKDWPPRHFAELAKRLSISLADKKPVFVLLAGPKQKEALKPITQAAEHCLVLCDLDLLSVYAVLQRCQLFIGNDSGLLQMASAAAIPALGLFGPTDEVRYGPYGAHAAIIRVASRAECNAQWERGESCMEQLAAAEVEKAAHALMGRKV